MSNPCMPTQHKQQPTASCLPNTEQNRTKPAFFLGKPTHVKDVESKQTPGFLSSISSPPWNSRNLQLRNSSVQDIEKCKNSKQWKTPTESTISPESSSTNSTSVQDAIENQNLNCWSTLPKSVVSPKCSKPSSAFVQDTTKEQNSKSWLNHSTAKFTRASTKKPQRNSYTDEAVNTLITEVNNLYYSDQKDINKQITQVFNNFKRGASYLTDDHRKQLLSIIPTISEIIDTRNLDSISITNLLHSLTKTNACCNLNPSNIPIDKCIQYEQSCKNLIDQILTKIQTYKKYQVRPWSITLYSLGELVEASPNLITSEQINNLMANLNIQKQSLTEFNPQSISNIFVAIVKLLKHNKLDSSSIATHSFLAYLLQQIKPAIGDFIAQDIANTLSSIDKLADFPDFIQLISDKQDIIELLLEEVITNKNLNWKPIDVSQVIYTLGMITENIYLNKKVANIVKEAYHTLYSKVPSMMPMINIWAASFLLSGINKLIRNNTITSNKPSKSFIRDVFLEKIIADTSIINNNHLYQYLNTIAHFQEYLTKNELIKILENINFFIPDINYVKSYFIAMGYLLAKIRKEIDNGKKNRKLIVLDHLIETEIKKAWLHFKPNIDSFNISLITAIHNTCSLIYKAEDLTLLKVAYEGEIHGSNFEEINLAIIKTLIADPESLKIEYSINCNLPPVDACIIQPDGSMLAIEIQGTGHYLDDEGEYPTGRHLLKSARLQIENIQVIDVNGSKLMSNNNPKYLAPHLINILLENNVKIRPEYCNNIPKLLRDSGFTSK